MQINQTKINSINIQNKKEALKEKQIEEQKPQQKEHCSSKAAKALRGMVLGLALAAGVAAGSKGMVAEAAGNNTPAPNNNTTVTQEVEENTQTSEVEMMADKLLDEQSYSNIHVGGKTTCHGEMRQTRNYDNAQITQEGQLVFLNEETNLEYVTGYQYNKTNGKFEYCTQLNQQTTYSPQNAFELGTEANDSIIKLQPGTRFDESVEKNGDYVELAEDGKTFNVFDSSGKQIGSCTFMTDEEAAKMSNIVAAGVGIGIGAGIAAAGIDAVISSKRKHMF